MEEITPTELKQELESGVALAVVDIREPDEYASWHIHGSINVPVYDALRSGHDDALLEQLESIPGGRPVITVCRMGVISRKAASTLRAHGFEAASLMGGIRGWGGVWSEARIALGPDTEAAFVQIRRNGKGCLSYLLGSKGEAAVFDPSVSATAYVDLSRREGLRITRVFETHVHADHLSRARELCGSVGAALLLPANERVTYSHQPLAAGQIVQMGDLKIEVVATPGHTSESVSFLIQGVALLTGDTLFVHGVGRPDLERGDAAAADGARRLHQSLHEVLERFVDVPVYPAHTPGAIGFDGVPIGAPLSELRTTLPLLAADQASFTHAVVGSLKAKPANFETIVAINEGKASLGPRDPLDLEAGPNRCAAL